MLKIIVADGRRLEAIRTFGMVFKVQSSLGSNAMRVVNLDRRTCTCKQFEDLGIPCVHACSAAFVAHVDVSTLCIEERRVSALRRVYAEGIMPVDMGTVPVEPVKPPFVRRLPGRP